MAPRGPEIDDRDLTIEIGGFQYAEIDFLEFVGGLALVGLEEPQNNRLIATGIWSYRDFPSIRW